MSQGSAVRPVPLALGGLIALAVSQGIGRFVYTPILPRMIEELGLTPGQAGLIASANFLGYLLGAIAASVPWLGGRPRQHLLGALLVSAVSGGAMGFVSSFPAFALLRCIAGAASAFVLIFASALVLERLRAAARPGLAALHFAGVGIGIVVAALVVAALAGQGASWSRLWVATGGVAFLGAVAVALLVPDAAPAREAVAMPGRGGASRPLALLSVAYGLFGFGYVVTATFLVAIVRGSADLRPLEGIIWVVFGLSAAPAVALWTWIGGRVGVLRGFALAAIFEASGVVLSVAGEAKSALIAAAILLGGTFMGLTALGLTAGSRLTAGDPRRPLALLTSAFGVGQIVGPGFAGLLFDRTGSFVLPSLVAAGALLAAAGIALRIRPGP